MVVLSPIRVAISLQVPLICLLFQSDSPFCNAATTATSKGTFHWHDTAAGGTAFLPCPLGVMGSFPDRRGAQRNCSVNGDWMEVEAEPCVHANEITRALHDLKEVIFANLKATLLCTALVSQLTEENCKWNQYF